MARTYEEDRRTGWGILTAVVVVLALVFLIGLAADWWGMGDETVTDDEFQTVTFENNGTNDTVQTQDGMVVQDDRGIQQTGNSI